MYEKLNLVRRGIISPPTVQRLVSHFIDLQDKMSDRFGETDRNQEEWQDLVADFTGLLFYPSAKALLWNLFLDHPVKDGDMLPYIQDSFYIFRVGTDVGDVVAWFAAMENMHTEAFYVMKKEEGDYLFKGGSDGMPMSFSFPPLHHEILSLAELCADKLDAWQNQFVRELGEVTSLWVPTEKQAIALNQIAKAMDVDGYSGRLVR